MNATQDEINAASVVERLEPWRQTLEIGPCSAGARDALPCQKISRPDWLRARVKEVARELNSTDVRAAASFWAKYYHAVLLAGVLPPLMTEGIGPLAPLETSAMVFASRYPSRLCLPAHAIIPADQLPCPTRDRVFSALIDDHLEPFIAAMSEAAGVSHRLLWSDVGLRCAWLFEQFRQTADPTRQGPIEACRTRLLRSATRPWSGGRNPLAGTVRQRRGGELADCGLIRTTCCGTHRLPGRGYCPTCPLPAATAQANEPGDATT